MRRALLVAFVAAAAPLAAPAQDTFDNPYKAARVGDYATFALTVTAGGKEYAGTVTMTVKALTEGEATIERTGTMNGMPLPAETEKFDRTKAVGPAELAALAGGEKRGGDRKITGRGKEKVEVAGQALDAAWYTLRRAAATPDGKAKVTTDSKVWLTPGVPHGAARADVTIDYNGMVTTMRLVVTEYGNKK